MSRCAGKVSENTLRALPVFVCGFAPCQCSSVGLCINWESLLTAYVMSGRVKARYCRLPTTDRYCVASDRAEMLLRVSLGDDGNGVNTGLASVMLFFGKKIKNITALHKM